MIPGNIDPRRPDKVQRYKPPAAGNGGAPGDDLTPDYMNILGPDSTTGNVQADAKVNETKKHMEVLPPSNPQQLNVLVGEDALKSKPELLHPANTTSNVIPTSPQYGVAIIPTATTNDIANEANTLATDTVTESSAKSLEPENKDMHSTPSKNDRFKVVKIASSEPFRRGRWKCMDYVDQTPPTTMQPNAGSVQMPSGNVYMQTQSLPPHQIQQLLLQSALAATQLYQGNMQSQVVPQAQYFYPGVQGQGNIPTQIINQPVVTATTVQPQFINSTQQQYFQPAIIPQNYQNLQFIQPAYQNQNNSAFVPATQNMQSFQPAQSYTGQPTVTQQNVVQPQVPTIPASQPQPIVNGFPYSPQNVTEQQITANNLPTQVAKNVIVTSNPAVVPQVAPQVAQNQMVQNQTPSVSSLPNQQESQNSISQTVPIQSQQQLLEQHNSSYQQGSQPTNPGIQNSPIQNVVVLQPCDQTNNVYTNPQFVASVHSLPIIEQNDTQVSDDTTETPSETTNGNSDDLAKTNPVVNAIDNKIEQAMDLVKSHLMYTVREEVEVLKEKIAELMERIQQLESENNFLRSQLPKHNPNSNSTSDPSPQQ